MGVPGYFKTLIKKNSKLLKDKITNVEYLFMDYNNIIHTAYQEYLKNNILKDMKKSEIQKKIISYIINKTLYIVNNIVKPVKLLYIAMDGVPPKAKMEQQRMRRYKKIYMDKLKKDLKKKYNLESTVWFDSNQISPGTIFMDKLSKELKKNKNKFLVEKIIISDTLERGEGEHKIINYIKENIEKKNNICIYGDDADLIFLVMTLTNIGKNINIMKSQSLNDENLEFGYLNVYEISENFYKYMEIEKKQKNKFLNDYIFLMMIFGDDFVKHLPGLNIRKHHKLIIDIYKKDYKKFREYLTKKIENKIFVNKRFLLNIFEKLGKLENKFLRQKQHFLTKSDKKISNINDSYESEMNYLEHGFIFEEDHPLYEIYKNDFNKIDYYSYSWKKNYYNHFFDNSRISEIMKNDYNKFRSLICREYFKSWKFTIEYYLCGVPDYKYYYPYSVAPFISDIYTNLKYLKLDMNNIKFNKKNNGVCYCPLEQLLIIMPPQMKNSLPKICKKIMSKKELKNNFPTTFKLNVVDGLKYIYSEPILNEINEKEIFSEIEKNLKLLNNAEKKRLV